MSSDTFWSDDGTYATLETATAATPRRGSVGNGGFSDAVDDNDKRTPSSPRGRDRNVRRDAARRSERDADDAEAPLLSPTDAAVPWLSPTFSEADEIDRNWRLKQNEHCRKPVLSPDEEEVRRALVRTAARVYAAEMLSEGGTVPEWRRSGFAVTGEKREGENDIRSIMFVDDDEPGVVRVDGKPGIIRVEEEEQKGDVNDVKKREEEVEERQDLEEEDKGDSIERSLIRISERVQEGVGSHVLPVSLIRAST